jgi:hypothetical protein
MGAPPTAIAASRRASYTPHVIDGTECIEIVCGSQTRFQTQQALGVAPLTVYARLLGRQPQRENVQDL